MNMNDLKRTQREVSKRAYKAVTEIRSLKTQVTDQHVEDICKKHDVAESLIRAIWGFAKGKNPNFINGQKRKPKRTHQEMQSRCANFEMKHTKQRCTEQCSYCKIKYARKRA